MQEEQDGAQAVEPAEQKKKKKKKLAENGEAAEATGKHKVFRLVSVSVI